MKKKLREIWHDLYFKFCSPSGEKFALTCQEATEQMNVESSRNFKNWLRLKLHLSLCQACVYYFQMGKILKSAAKEFLTKNEKQINLEKLNQELLDRYAHTRSNK